MILRQIPMGVQGGPSSRGTLFVDIKLLVLSQYKLTPLCKIIPAYLNFRGLAPPSLSNQPQPAKSAIYGKIGGKTINLAGPFLHNGV